LCERVGQKIQNNTIKKPIKVFYKKMKAVANLTSFDTRIQNK